MHKQGIEDVKLYPLASMGICKGLYEVYVKPEISVERLVIAAGVLAFAWLGSKAIQADLELMRPD